MTEIVFNNNYGCFGISKEAVLLGRKLSDDPNWSGSCLNGEIDDQGNIYDQDCIWYDGKRDDETLVKVVKQLGDKSFGICANLEIVKLEKGTKYHITNCDGLEDIITIDDIEWLIA